MQIGIFGILIISNIYNFPEETIEKQKRYIFF